MNIINKIEKKCNSFFLGLNYLGNNIEILKEIVLLLNKKGIIIITGLLSVNKTELVKEIVIKTNKINDFFYINTDIDIYNQIKGHNQIEELYKNQKIIILENISKIINIDLFIKKYKESGKKIIIIGNDYKKTGINQIEILTEYNKENNSNLLKNIQEKKDYIQLVLHKIITKEIIIQNNIKNFFQIRAIIEFFTENIPFISVREIGFILKEKGINIANITLIEYINAIINSKLIKKVYQYNIKDEKQSSGKSKYYFSDSNLSYNLSRGNIPFHLLVENIVFQKLEQMKGQVYSGKNGAFEWSFITKEEPNNKNLIIHISKHTEKNEVKKEAKKILKIPGEYKKILLVKSIKDIGIRPSTYLPLVIMEIHNFIQS